MTDNKPICAALDAPIRYASKDKSNRRYAGPDLAPDLAKRNLVGARLGCWD